ncbi:MAG: hypothetical protein IJ571_07220 [Ruminococcus sp.]|nr:hypothetical protein [Ruminococcus sp.]
MELFDRDDLKKALIYLVPLLIIIIAVAFSMRMPKTKKSDDSSEGSTYSYGSGEMPFTIYVDSTRVDLVWDDDKIIKAIKNSFSKDRGHGLITGSAPEISEGLRSRTFTVTAPQTYGARVTLPQGFNLGEGLEGISRGLSDECIRNEDDNNCAYFWAFYLDNKEIDYSKLDFSIADDEGAYMKNMLMGRVCELYCQDQLTEGKAHVCTSIMITTADKVCDSCTIKVMMPEDLTAKQ